MKARIKKENSYRSNRYDRIKCVCLKKSDRETLDPFGEEDWEDKNIKKEEDYLEDLDDLFVIPNDPDPIYDAYVQRQKEFFSKFK